MEQRIKEKPRWSSRGRSWRKEPIIIRIIETNWTGIEIWLPRFWKGSSCAVVWSNMLSLVSFVSMLRNGFRNFVLRECCKGRHFCWRSGCCYTACGKRRDKEPRSTSVSKQRWSTIGLITGRWYPCIPWNSEPRWLSTWLCSLVSTELNSINNVKDSTSRWSHCRGRRWRWPKDNSLESLTRSRSLWRKCILLLITTTRKRATSQHNWSTRK